MERMERVLSHFEQEAKEYDDIIIRLIPDYELMVSILVDFVNQDRQDHFSIVDLGCGTGTLSKAIAMRFPHAAITCVDISEKMLQIAESKLCVDIATIHADFGQFVFPQKYDVIVSSLALHHLETDDDKLSFYKKIYAALPAGGIFLNIDVVTAGNDRIQEKYMEHWKEFMIANTSVDEVENKWLPNYHAEDRPTSLSTHFKLLEQSGFCQMDCVYKNYNYAVFLAEKS
ncbi:class I SAM-dependent methyltransferase [Ohessyouella blattaphilus]|uniref:class I SAM-dependent methyltransferase n=1 Tax=Ohessyouella blattaphilus TaxID=2949333 RepID=UPI003EB9E9E7